MPLNFVQRTGLRLCALAITAVMISDMIRPACSSAVHFFLN